MVMSSTRKALDDNMITIRDDLLRMFSLVDRATEGSFRAFRNHDIELANACVAEDQPLDDLMNKTEELITRTIALQQPTARDLRILIADLLIATELERMGDHAQGTAKTVLRYEKGSDTPLPDQLPEMERKVRAMLSLCSEAFIEWSAEKARACAELDSELDTLYNSLFSGIVKQMQKGKLRVERGTYLLWAGHNLERIGDRVTNICERIVYARTGDVTELNP